MAGQYPQYTHWAPVPYEQPMLQPDAWSSKSIDQFHTDETGVLGNSFLKKRSFRQKWFGGLLLTLRAFATLSACILFFNIGWFGWAMAKFGTSGGYGTIQRGSCDETKSLNKWLHLVINILSTGLILSSTAFMQLCNAPTRGEIEEAHRHHRWLSIGILSPRNFGQVSRKKSLLFWILALSSTPFHLLYNSVVYSSLAGNEYHWGVVTEGFLDGDSFNLRNASSNMNLSFDLPVVGPINSTMSWDTSPDATEQGWADEFLQIQQNASTYERLDSESCLKAYFVPIIDNRRNLLLVSSDKNSSNSVLAFSRSTIDNEGDTDPISWICSAEPDPDEDVCDPTPFLKDPSSWKVYGHPIGFCLSEIADATCALKFSSVIAILVIICNLIKVVAMFYILFSVDIASTITCHGDAVASFLTREDQHTLNMNMSMANRRDFESWRLFDQGGWYSGRQNRSSRRWASAVTRRRWIFSTLVMIAALFTVLIILISAMQAIGQRGVDTSISNLWRLGFGAINQQMLAASDNFGTPAALALLANLPQLILAWIYLVYNSLLRLLFAAQDYSQFASEPQYLMVNSPRGQQRGTWFFGFPLSWALPMVVLQALLHW